jgi:hypothetical protein
MRPEPVRAWGVLADARRVESCARHWEIAYRGFGHAWYRLGWSEGQTAVTALQAWIDERGRRVPRGTFGLRSATGDDWEVFRVDPRGAVSMADRSLEDEWEASEDSR